MDIGEMLYWPLAAFFFVISVLFSVTIFSEGNSIADHMTRETNKKTIVYENRSDLSAEGYKKRQLLIDGSSIVSDVMNTESSVNVSINNSAGFPSKLSEDERKSMRNKGDTSPVLNRINISRKYKKTYAYDSDSNLISVEYSMN